MKYKCNFPLCEYSTTYRSKIDHHHIIPKEISKTTQTIPLCKNHHSLIFHPDAKHGQHSINTTESIQILAVYNSTGGNTLCYQDYDGKAFYYFMESGEVVPD